jgi:phosphocarrier protein FPr/phosphocarrier protein
LLRVDIASVVARAKSLVMPIILIEAEGWQWQPPSNRAWWPRAVFWAASLAMRNPADQVMAGTDRTQPPRALGSRPARPPKCAACRMRARFAAKVTVEKSGATAAITSPSAMLRLGVGHGDAIHLVAQGDEAGEALDAICALIESGMGEFLALSQDVVIEAPVFAVQAPQAGDRITGVTAATGMAVGTAWRPRRAEPELATVSQGALAEKSLLNDALTLRAQLSAQSMSGTAQQKRSLARILPCWMMKN